MSSEPGVSELFERHVLNQKKVKNRLLGWDEIDVLLHRIDRNIVDNRNDSHIVVYQFHGFLDQLCPLVIVSRDDCLTDNVRDFRSRVDWT